jgi:hypothetical protein
MVRGHDGRLLQPFAVVVLPMVEPSRRIPLRAAVDVYLLPYRPAGACGLNEDEEMRGHRFGGAPLVPRKMVRQLSHLPWVRDEALSDHISEARLLPDGRVLLFFGEGQNGALYPSREALERVLRDGAERPARISVASRRALLPPVADFLRDVEAHAKSLAARLRIPDEALDLTVASFDAVDAKTIMPENVPALVAYVGQVLIRATEGRWTTLYPRRRYLAREQPDGTTRREWATTIDEDDEPTIMTRDGRLFMPLVIVTLEMDRQQYASLRRAVTEALFTEPRGVEWGRIRVRSWLGPAT